MPLLNALLKYWKRAWSMLSKLLRRSRGGDSVEPEPAPHVDKALERKLARQIQRGAAKAVDTCQGGPNIPRYQFCPRGHGSKKRTRKTMGGAYYGCKKCGDFFVRAPGL